MGVPASFLILHGLGNHRPPDHWQFWLAAQLAASGHQVVYPGLPAPDNPSFPIWEAALHTHLEELTGDERVVVCHSLSCLLWFAAAPAISAKARPDRLLLVAPPDSAQLPDQAAEFRLHGLDTAAIKRSVRREVRIACGDDDPYNPLGAQATYGTALGLDVDVVPGAAHLTPESGYGPWPAIETWCTGGGMKL